MLAFFAPVNYHSPEMNASNLVTLLKAKHITQYQLAHRLRVSRASVSYWCNGKKAITPVREAQIRTILKEYAPSSRQNLANLRARLGKDKHSFAEYLGVKVNTLSLWLNGKKEIPSAIQELLMLHPLLKSQRSPEKRKS